MKRKAFESLVAVNTAIERASIAVISILLGVIVATMMCAVIWRYALNNPISWADDLSLISMVWMTLLGLSPGMRHGHLAVEGLVSVLPDAAQALINALVYLSVLVTAAMVIYFGVKFVDQGMARIVPSMQWLKFGYVYLSVPVGFGLIVPFCIECALRPFLTHLSEPGAV